MEESNNPSPDGATEAEARRRDAHRPPQGVDPTATGPSMFDLPTATGDTDSERFLAALCRRSFLRLWSYPNTYTDEGLREGKASSGNEFADVLVVFGDDVIIFSDKDIRFNTGIALETAWPRWFKSAVAKSVRQLHGARNWALRFPERIYLDATCQRPLPARLPTGPQARIHLVATTRGSVDACAQLHEGSFGSHLINTSIVGDEHREHPFTIGRVEPNKPFVHVFDELTLERVLKERDTAADFIAYLRAREAFLTTPDLTVIAAGEEQLLAAYLSNMRDEQHWFVPASLDLATTDTLWFDESHWAHLAQRPEYRAKKRADRSSYVWDTLVDRFIALGDPALLGQPLPANDLEYALRIIASKSRFERRFLVDALMEAMRAAEATPGARRFRLFTTLQEPHVAFVFHIEPMVAGEAYDTYRQRRAAILNTYLQCAPLRMVHATMFVGMAFDHPAKEYGGASEDLIVYRLPDGGITNREELRRVADELGILAESLPLQHRHTQDFPAVHHQRAATPKKPRGACERKAKARRKMAKASKRKNR